MITNEQFIKDFKELLSTSNDIDMETDLLDIDEWDSFSAMSFLEMIESKYNVKIEPFSIAEAVLVEDLFSLIEKNQHKGDERK